MGLLTQTDLPKRAVVVAPHADDEILGAGGFMAKAADAGWAVQVLFATVAGYSSAPKQEASTTAAREAELERALAIAGVAGHRILFRGEQHHLHLDRVPQFELIGFVEQALHDIRPTILVFPCHGHYHQDHRAVSDACIAATRPAPDGPRPFVPFVLAYGHAHGGWGGQHVTFFPDTFVDITAVIERKLAALAAYASQLCESPHPRSLEAIRGQAAAAGAYAGVAYAEPFECLRCALL